MSLTLFNKVPAVRKRRLNPLHSNICQLEESSTSVGQCHQARERKREKIRLKQQQGSTPRVLNGTFPNPLEGSNPNANELSNQIGTFGMPQAELTQAVSIHYVLAENILNCVWIKKIILGLVNQQQKGPNRNKWIFILEIFIFWELFRNHSFFKSKACFIKNIPLHSNRIKSRFFCVLTIKRLCPVWLITKDMHKKYNFHNNN